jgi:hypothetical protein
MARFLKPLIERRTYAETLDLLLDLVFGTLWFTLFTTLIATGASLLITLAGLPILTATFFLARAAGWFERRRAMGSWAFTSRIPFVDRRRATGFGTGSLRPFRDRTTWKEPFYLWLVQPVQSVVNFTVAVTAWAVPRGLSRCRSTRSAGKGPRPRSGRARR